MVTFEFKSLGSIKKANLQLAPLTVIAGANNSGKTYLTYAVYSYLKNWAVYFSYPGLQSLAKKLLSEKSIKIPLDELLEQRPAALATISERFNEQIHNVFGAPESTFESATVNANVEGEPLDVEKLLLSVSSADTGRISFSIDREFLTFALTGEELGLNPRGIFSARRFINSTILNILFKDIFPRPFIITSERMGVSLFYKELDSHRNVLVDQLLKTVKSGTAFDPFEMLEEVVSRYSEPVADHIAFTRGLETAKKGKSFLERDGKGFSDIEEMMGGTYRVGDSELLFKSKARKNGYSIPLYMGSGAVRSLSDLFFYLKYVCQEGDVLLIDEPESHLSPGNQILVARMLCRLVNYGVQVLITTHSDYIIKEINNLVMLSSVGSERQAQLINKFGYNPYDVLSCDKVKAYVTKSGGLEACYVCDRGITVPPFDQAIDQINAAADEIEYALES